MTDQPPAPSLPGPEPSTGARSGSFSPMAPNVSPFSGRPPMPPDGRAYFDAGTGSGPSTGPQPASTAGNGRRKRSRQMSRTSGSGSDTRRGSEAVNGAGGSGPKSSPPGSSVKGEKDGQQPSILVREKKQKACANCRRAKLKCIVEENESDCVRCRARKEKCIFYPRGHDEDWQQTLTADLYNAVGHLAQLSDAVHHILDHLAVQGAVPPLDRALPRFDAPDRDLSILQGWGAERNRELGDGSRKRSRRSKKDDGDDDDGDENGSSLPGHHFASDYQPMDPMGNGTQSQGPRPLGPPPSNSSIRPSDMHMGPPRFDMNNTSPNSLQFVPGHTGHPGGHVPGHGPGGGQHVMGISDVDLGLNNYPLPSPHGAQQGQSGRSMSVSAGPASLPSAGAGVTPDNLSSISPVDATFVAMMDSGTSTSQGGSSALTTTRGGSFSSNAAHGGIFGLLNGPSAGPTAVQRPTAIIHPDEQEVPTFANDNLGSTDPRPNIVKRGLIGNPEALNLVNYFHSRLSPWLFGYSLRFAKFPYIADGPSAITPFILSVMCLIAAERAPPSHRHIGTLATEVSNLLNNSPADSFISTLDQPFGGGTGNRDEEGEEDLDPELGIGPEEIVGACILATFITEREQAATIASSAFKWARGWIKSTSQTVPQPPTLGEVCGLLPIKRDATREDMARLWLLCYIVDGTEALQRDNPIPPRRDPLAYCQVLVPDAPLPGDSYSPHDVLLTFHARLITYLREWYHRRSQNEAATAGAGMAAQAAANARLASSINASLTWWRADLEAHSLDSNWMRYINLFWEFARMLVNATSAKSLEGNPRLRAASWALGVEAAVGLLEKCSAWPNRSELANLPPCYLSMITLAGSVLVDANKDNSTESAFQPSDTVPLLNNVADMLAAGGLPPSHVARTTGGTLRGYAEQLAHMS